MYIYGNCKTAERETLHARRRDIQFRVARRRRGLSIAGTVVLIVLAAIHSDAWGVVSSAIFGASLIILYTMSTLYHAITNPRAKAFFRIMDHNTIFFLIAGTYTPITLVPLRGALGWVLFGIVWGAAVLGIVFNSIDLEKFRKPSVVCYIAMGWVIVIAIKPMLQKVSPLSLWFLLIGGLFYTVGVIFYVKKRRNTSTRYGICSPSRAAFSTTLRWSA